MGDLKTYVKKIVQDVIKTNYSAMDKMHSMIAQVTDIQREAETYRYTVRLLEDKTELPNLVSDKVYQKGDTVVIQFVEGIYPYIVGRWYG